MIRQIDNLRNLGILRNFQWGGLTNFTKKNLIYGWNYSGKTTLSRVFSMFESPERLASYPGVSFRVTLEDGTSFTEATLAHAPKTRVFNRDFVSENFAQEHTAPAVFILGAANVVLRQRLERLGRRRDRVGQIQVALHGQAALAQTEIDQVGTDQARNVGQLLGDRTFKRPNLTRRAEEVRPNFAMYILTDDQVTAKYEVCRSTTGWTTLTEIQNTLADIEALSARIADILSQTAANRAIERLKTNHNLESWVRTGLELHQDRQRCEFCDSTISQQRLDDLRGHFSREYEALVRELSVLVTACESLSFVMTMPDERDFVPELKTGFEGLKGRFENWTAWANELKSLMVNTLMQKQTNVETAQAWVPDLSRAAEGVMLLGQINTLIQRHNQMAGQLEQTKADARTALERHHAALLFRDHDLTTKEGRVSQFQARATKATQVLQLIAAEISALEIQVRQQSIGAAKLNEILRYLLTGGNIEVAAVGDSLFEFRRDGVQATNLSDGEKTAVSFAYFITSLEANGATLADTIVFIDDPISSLDVNHIYAVHALIVRRLGACRQVFLSTHNSELFQLIKDAWFNPHARFANNAEASAYYIRRAFDNGGVWSASIEDLPDLLRRYRSEYQFTFAQLHRFANFHTPTLHEAYTAPNLLRKFLEAYLGFRKPSVSKWSDKLDMLFATGEEQLEIQRFANDSSHLQGIGRALQQPDFIPNAQRCVLMVLQGLRARDFEHYQSLCVIIGATP